MSSEAINIVLNLSPNGSILNFSVQKSEICEGLTKVESEFDFQNCPTCTCRIFVFSRQSAPQIKTEVLSESESVADIFDIKADFGASSDEDAKPVVEIFANEPDANAGPELCSNRLDTNPYRYKTVAPVRCLHCKRIFRNEILLAIHQQRHGIVGEPTEPVPGAVKCTKHCRRFFESEEELQKHLTKAKKATEGGSYKCDKCPEVFRLLKHYRLHLFTHGPVKCHKCQAELKDKLSYKKHMKTHVKVRAYRCTMCNQTFDSEKTIGLHTRWVHEQNRTCFFCGKAFSHWQHILEHEDKHKNIFRYQCHQCHATFLRKSSLAHHLEKHQEEEFFCDFCGTSYKGKDLLQTHIFNYHVQSDPEQIFKCAQCEKTFTSLVIYKDHLWRHWKTYPCSICGKLFKYRSSVSMHCKTVHADLKQREKFECETCGKLFLAKTSLRHHLNLHKEVAEFKCRYCSKSMTSFHHLKRHEMMHTDERPFPCQTCGKYFRSTVQLKAHNRLHTGETPFECPLEECKKRFRTQSSQRAHVLVHERQMNVKLMKKKYDLNDV